MDPENDPELISPDYHPAADTPHPAELAPQPQAPSQFDQAQAQPVQVQPGQSVRNGQDYAVSQQGMTHRGLVKAAKIQSNADRLAAADSAPQIEMYKQAGADADRIAQQQHQIELQRGQQENEHWARQGEYDEAIRNINETHAKAQQEAWDLSKVKEQQYLSNYENQLAGIRQLAVYSGNPYQQMSKPETIGLIAAHFAQGFLAPAGIHIDVAGMTDRWVNQSINEHQQFMQNAQGMAQQQLHLYDIARQQASDDWEARERYRGMVLEGLKAQVAVEGDRFNSELAKTNAQARIAEIDAHLNQTKLALGERMFKTEYDNRKLRIEQARDQAHAAAEMLSAKASMMNAETNRDKANAKQSPTAGLMPVYDPFSPDGKRVVAYLDVKNDKDGAKKLRDREESTRKLLPALDRVEALKKQLDQSGFEPSILGPGMDARLSSLNREYRNARQQVIDEIRHAMTGAAFSKEEGQTYINLLPPENWWEKGSNPNAVMDMRERLRTDFEAGTRTYDVTKSDVTVGEQQKAIYEMVHPKDGSMPKQVDTIGDDASRQVRAPEANMPVAPSRAFNEVFGGEKQLVDRKGHGEPQKMQVVETLTAIALDPQHARTLLKPHQIDMLPENDQLAANSAREALMRLANEPDVNLSSYAQIMLQRMEQDPVGLKRTLGFRDVKMDDAQWSIAGSPKNE